MTWPPNENARVAAACAILDRGYGRPAQAIEHDTPPVVPDDNPDLLALCRQIALALYFAGKEADELHNGCKPDT